MPCGNLHLTGFKVILAACRVYHSHLRNSYLWTIIRYWIDCVFFVSPALMLKWSPVMLKGWNSWLTIRQKLTCLKSWDACPKRNWEKHYRNQISPWATYTLQAGENLRCVCIANLTQGYVVIEILPVQRNFFFVKKILNWVIGCKENCQLIMIVGWTNELNRIQFDIMPSDQEDGL